jgi:hypothetical protein
VDLRYFELHDLLCEAVIALESGEREVAPARVQKALRWIEADWLATPGVLPGRPGTASPVPDEEPDGD